MRRLRTRRASTSSIPPQTPTASPRSRASCRCETNVYEIAFNTMATRLPAPWHPVLERLQVAGLDVNPNDRTIATQQAHRHRPERSRKEIFVVPTVKDALRSGAQGRELDVERVLRDGDDLVEPVHLRALDDLARRVTTLVGELERPPATVGVLLDG